MNSEKVISLNEMITMVDLLKKQGKRIVQSHGIFDLIHPGIITHLQEAEKAGDILIVTVVRDENIDQKHRKFIFNEKLRALNVASISGVDYVAIVDEKTPYDSIKAVRPDIFATGGVIAENAKEEHYKYFVQKREETFGDIEIYKTKGLSHSFSQILHGLDNNYNEATSHYVKEIQKKYSFLQIEKIFETLKNKKILLIGDSIIDEYHFCAPMGKSAKSQVVVNSFLESEVYAGGALAVANHLSHICNEVELITLLGSTDSREDFIKSSLRTNIKLKHFYRNDGPSVIKKRYVDQGNNQKLFEINYIKNEQINPEVEQKIIDYINEVSQDFDMILVSDFGHGLMTPKLIQTVVSNKIPYAVNAQTNAANLGYNLITKYTDPLFVCLDEPEARWATQERVSDIEKVIEKLSSMINSKNSTITLGKKGSISMNQGEEIVRTPILSKGVVDTVGAGDAFFAYAAPLVLMRCGIDLVSFIGNSAGALAVKIIGNKQPVQKASMLEFIHSIFVDDLNS